MCGIRLYIRGAPKGLRILRVARETSAESTSIRPGVAPAASASDHLLVSRATRNILSTFGQGGMYSGLAPRRAVWPKADYQRARPKAAPRTNYNGLGPRLEKRPPNRPRCSQVRHLEASSTIRRSFLERLAKSSALLAFPRCTAGLPQGVLCGPRQIINGLGPRQPHDQIITG